MLKCDMHGLAYAVNSPSPCARNEKQIKYISVETKRHRNDCRENRKNAVALQVRNDRLTFEP